MTKVFIDGSAGTTGLRIHERLRARKDIVLLSLSPEKRKDEAARREKLNEADIVFLCLPDDAAKEAVSFIENDRTAVIDTSTAHRTADGWEYGFPELEGRRERLKTAKRIANPGCHAGGFIALVEPLIRRGALKKDAALTCLSLTGYSGGGKKTIAAYEADGRDPLFGAPRLYALSQRHKHLPEMTKICGLDNAPAFLPVIAPFYAGMEVVVPLFGEEIGATPQNLAEIYRSYYTEGVVRFSENPDEDGFLSAAAFCGRDDMQIAVCGNAERILLISRFDNLGKGASGAAVQNMNLLLGAQETCGLIV